METGTVEREPSSTRDAVAAALVALRERYQAIEQSGAPGVPTTTARERAEQLLITEAAWRYRTLQANRPPHVAVVGPTQVGKSTVVNLLLGAPAADVSPLAGYTVHPQGFWTGAGGPDAAWSLGLFPGWRRCLPAQLQRERLDTWALTSAPAPTSNGGGLFGFLRGSSPAPAPLPACVVWDTPDFDSLSADAYRRGVTETIALADVLVLVVSKEKYSDLRVWSMLRQIAPLQMRLLVCLNKTAPEAAETIRSELATRLADLCPTWRTVPLVTVSYDAQRATRPQWNTPDAEALRAALRPHLTTVPPASRASAARRLIRAGWDDWTAPLTAERNARGEWPALVRAALDEIVSGYEREFLSHPQRYDTLQRVTVELLALLEVPVIGRALQTVRAVVTWPLRSAWRAGRTWVQAPPPPPPAEQFVLAELMQRLLLRLERDAGRRASEATLGQGVWTGILRVLTTEGATLHARLRDAADAHRAALTEDVRAAARSLYDALQGNPALLHTLRALRAGTDLAGLVLAVKTGGVPLHDLLLAPALLSVTSLLSEGALGAYVKAVGRDLRERQAARLRSELCDGRLAPLLNAVVERISNAGLFGVPLEQIDAARRHWESDSDDA